MAPVVQGPNARPRRRHRWTAPDGFDVRTSLNPLLRPGRRDWLAAGALIAATAGLQWWLAQRLPFDPDELDHLHQAFLQRAGRAPFVDFLVEKPPLLAAFLTPLTEALGDQVLWIYRLPFMAIAVATAAMTYACARRVVGGRAAMAALAGVCVATPFDVAGLSIRPDGLLAFFLVASFFFLHRWERQSRPFDAVAVGVCAGAACVAKLLPAPVLVAIAVWMAWRREWLGVGGVSAGAAVAGAIGLLLSGANAVRGFAFVAELWTITGASINSLSLSSFTDYLRHEPVLFGSAAVAALVLLVAPRSGGGPAQLLAVSYLLLWSMVLVKGSSHMQDLLGPLVVGALMVGIAMRDWRTPWIVAYIVAVTIEGAFSLHWLLDRELRLVQYNPFVILAQAQRCGPLPLDVDTFASCFRARLPPDDIDRLSLAQQTAASHRIAQTIGQHDRLEAFSSMSLNVASLNSHSFSPPQVYSLYERIPLVYEAIASGRAPRFAALLGAMAKATGHHHAFESSNGGLDAGLYRVLAEDEPPALIHLDRALLDFYAGRPALYDFLREHYDVAFDVDGAIFLACHRTLLPDACRTITLGSAQSAVAGAAEVAFQRGVAARSAGDDVGAAQRFDEAARASRGRDLDAVLALATARLHAGRVDDARALSLSMQKNFIWRDNAWRAMDPSSVLFTRDPVGLPLEFDALTRKVAAGHD